VVGKANKSAEITGILHQTVKTLEGAKRRTSTKVEGENKKKMQTNSVIDWRSGTDESSIK